MCRNQTRQENLDIVEVPFFLYETVGEILMRIQGPEYLFKKLSYFL